MSNNVDLNVAKQASVNCRGQVAIVTGAGRGLGRAYALALAASGARVVVNGRGSDAAIAEQSVVAEIVANGGDAVVEIASVTNVDAVNAMVARVKKRWGRIDILVNNAGAGVDRRFLDSELSDIEALLDVHLMGAIRCSHAVWPTMQKQKYGRIIMLTSVSAFAGNFGQSAYAAAKMGVVGLMKSLAIEGEKYNVYVNALSPLGVTRMNVSLLPDHLKTIFDARKVAPFVVFLASELAPNGETLMTGGGACELVQVCTSASKYATSDLESVARQFELFATEREWKPIRHVTDQIKIEIESVAVATVNQTG